MNVADHSSNLSGNIHSTSTPGLPNGTFLSQKRLCGISSLLNSLMENARSVLVFQSQPPEASQQEHIPLRSSKKPPRRCVVTVSIPVAPARRVSPLFEKPFPQSKGKSYSLTTAHPLILDDDDPQLPLRLTVTSPLSMCKRPTVKHTAEPPYPSEHPCPSDLPTDAGRVMLSPLT